MTGELPTLASDIDRDGFTLLRGVFDAAEVAGLRDDLTDSFGNHSNEAIRRSTSGHVFAARNLLQFWAAAKTCWRRREITDALNQISGPNCGLVRGLFFDKPPERTWSLPWHKDLTIAVKDNVRSTRSFTNPTTKCGVPHVEATTDILEQMLTVRIHLDPARPDNGALVIMPGSHRHGKKMSDDDATAMSLDAAPGDVLLIRPLVAHCSRSSEVGTTLHRRIVHLEFAANTELPDGYQWYDFYSVN
jgi:ectoine hydroxylase-related dioxygenase (phytanoyl-CoA dioxygenase family)